MNSALRIVLFALAVGGVIATGAAVNRHVPVASAQDRTDDGWLGVTLQDLDRDLRDALDLGKDANGAVVGRVVTDSPADEAGLRRLDLIVKIGADPVRDVDDAIDRIRDKNEGDSLDITVIRRGTEHTYTVKLGSRDDRFGEAPSLRGGPGVVILPHDRHGSRVQVYSGDGSPLHFWHEEEGGFLGVETMELNEQLSVYFGAKEGGVLVTKVVKDGPAEKAGLAAGDVIVSVAGREIDDGDRLRRTVRRYDPEEAVEVVVLRRGERKTVSVTLGDVRDFGSRYESPFEGYGFRFDHDIKFDGRTLPRLDSEDWQRQMELLRESLRDIREKVHRDIHQNIRNNVRYEVREGMLEAQRAMDEARQDRRRAVNESTYD